MLRKRQVTTDDLQTSRTSAQSQPRQHRRTRFVIFLLYLLFFAIIGRLFYWQVLNHDNLQAQAESQYTRNIQVPAHRGKILTSDNFVLVDNKNVYRLFVQPNQIGDNPGLVAQSLSGLLGMPSTDIAAKLIGSKTILLKSKVDEDTKQKIDALHISGLSFDPYEVRDYPEASMAAQLTGFVGKDKDGNDIGYFGVEGALDRELRGHPGEQTFLKDGLGFQSLFSAITPSAGSDGRDVVLTIRRDIQHTVEDMLQKGLQKYQATAGEVIVMDPKTGKILAMAATPSYDQSHYSDYDQSTYKSPSLTNTYEPGSIFKVLTVAAGIDAGVITPDTVCTKCSGPREIANYTIKTWNDVYNPNITMTNALAKSDNVAMIFVSELLGRDRFLNAIQKFMIGEPTQIELQEDTGTPIRKDWKPIDLATASFGQGIVTTGMQMVRAVGAIANNGVMMRPTIIDKVIDPSDGSAVPVEPVVEHTVVSPATAQAVTQMMVYTADNGEAKWAASKTHLVATKTGTAQVPIAGHYDPTKTIASFIGFAPPDNPKFVMLVKLEAPKSSPWAAETAAPLWFQIADKLYLLLNVPPDR